jgi:hypothetical protein
MDSSLDSKTNNFDTIQQASQHTQTILSLMLSILPIHGGLLSTSLQYISPCFWKKFGYFVCAQHALYL